MTGLQIVFSLLAVMIVLFGIAGVCASPPLFTEPERSSMSKTKATLWYVLAFVVFMIVVAILAFFGNGLNYAVNKTFAPLNEQVRHETFECSASHSDGIAREIRQYQDQYNALDPNDVKTPGARVLLRQRVLQDFESQTGTDCPLPTDVQTFVTSIR
jgi:multisubunit Na+/H+ antiporter MnhG subunit